MTAVTMGTCLTASGEVGSFPRNPEPGRKYHMRLRILPLLLAAAPAMIVACAGGSADELARATPSFDAISMEISDLDAEAPGTALQVDPSLTADEALATSDACHPHLFLRTHDVVAATNAAVW